MNCRPHRFVKLEIQVVLEKAICGSQQIQSVMTVQERLDRFERLDHMRYGFDIGRSPSCWKREPTSTTAPVYVFLCAFEVLFVFFVRDIVLRVRFGRFAIGSRGRGLRVSSLWFAAGV